MKNDPGSSFARLLSIMGRLRGPGGCPWDAEQSHASLKRHLLEETYEVLEAIDNGSDELLKEELGDLMLQPVFHAAIASERGAFDIADVMETLSDKLVRRHPHVFGDMVIEDSEAQIANWDQIKKHEKQAERPSALSGIPPHLPALLKALKITEKASRVGFDWEKASQVMDKVHEELQELEEAIEQKQHSAIEAELGDLLFAVANLARFLSIDPEDALQKTINRFQGRFQFIEQQLKLLGKQPQDSNLEEMEALWVEAKDNEVPH